MWEKEQRVLRWHEERTGTRRAHLDATRPAQAQVLRTLTKQTASAAEAHAPEKAPRLTVEQLEVLHRMLSQRTSAVTGWAGSGKGAVAAAAGEVWRSHGKRVHAIAVAGKKAVDLADQLGAGTSHMTVAQFIHRRMENRLQLGDHDVVVLDEGSMVSTDQWDDLRTAIGSTATLVMLGDDAQLPAIGAGGLWPLLARGSPELVEVHRIQSEWEREATTHLRHGRSAAAFSLYAGHGRLRLSATRADSLERAVGDWARDGRTGLLITDATNAERDWLNTAAQKHRVLAGELGTDSVTVARNQGEFALRGGDRVIFTAPHWSGSRERVENGTTGVVQSVDSQRGTVTIQTSGPTRCELTLAAANAPLELHYAAHVYKAQGATIASAYLITGGWQTSKESLYVACTRARKGTRVYLDRESLGRDIDAEAIAEAARRGAASRAKVAATTHAAESGTAGDRHSAEGTPRLRVRRRTNARPRRSDRRPLTERYAVRKRRQHALSEGRIRRSNEALRRNQAQDIPRPTLEMIAATEGVPVWALEVAEAVTGESQVSKHIVRQQERALR